MINDGDMVVAAASSAALVEIAALSATVGVLVVARHRSRRWVSISELWRTGSRMVDPRGVAAAGLLAGLLGWAWWHLIFGSMGSG